MKVIRLVLCVACVTLGLRLVGDGAAAFGDGNKPKAFKPKEFKPKISK